MRRLVAAETHEALNLEGAHSLLAGEHQMSDAEPVAEGLFGVLKDRARDGGKAIAVRIALAALPMKRLVAGGVVQVRIATARAMNALRPAAGHEVAEWRFLIPKRENGLELGGRHLRNWLRRFCHGGYPPKPQRKEILPCLREFVNWQIIAALTIVTISVTYPPPRSWRAPFRKACLKSGAGAGPAGGFAIRSRADPGH